MIHPIMQWVTYLGYVGIAVVGALRVTAGALPLGSVTAFIQYSREFNQPLGQLAGLANMIISAVARSEERRVGKGGGSRGWSSSDSEVTRISHIWWLYDR